MKVREVYPAGGRQLRRAADDLGGRVPGREPPPALCNADCSVSNEFSLPSNVSISSPNNATILIADSGYAARSRAARRQTRTTRTSTSRLPGGAVCWTDGSPPDCVAWGNFTGPLPTHVPGLRRREPGLPGGVTAGKALRRSIASGCSTFLEQAGDTDDTYSAADFSEQTPNPAPQRQPGHRDDVRRADAADDDHRHQAGEPHKNDQRRLHLPLLARRRDVRMQARRGGLRELRSEREELSGAAARGYSHVPGSGHRRKRHRPRRQRHLDNRPDAADDDHRHQAGGPKSRSECGVQISRERGVDIPMQSGRPRDETIGHLLLPERPIPLSPTANTPSKFRPPTRPETSRRARPRTHGR